MSDEDDRWISSELDVGGMPGHYDYEHGNDHPHCPGCREMRQARREFKRSTDPQ